MSCLLLATIFILAGANHFRSQSSYERTIPPFLPWAALLVQVSGIAEIAGGIGLLIPRLRWLAGWGLIALLIAVFPANVYMAVAPDRFADLGVPTWVLWARLPIQIVLILWVWWSAIKRSAAQ